MTTLISGEQLTNGHLGKVAVVVALHLEVKHLGLGIARLGDEELVEEVEHVIANVPQLFLHLKKVLCEYFNYSRRRSRQSKFGLQKYSKNCPLVGFFTKPHLFPVLLSELLLLLASLSLLLDRRNNLRRLHLQFWNTSSQLKDLPSMSSALPRPHSCRQPKADSFPKKMKYELQSSQARTSLESSAPASVTDFMEAAMSS